jgi:hypothetical protein
MPKADAARIRTAIGRAEALLMNETPRHRAMIAARVARHPEAGVVDGARYAAGMRTAGSRDPGDGDSPTRAAGAPLNLHPYDGWEKAGNPKSRGPPKTRRRSRRRLSSHPITPARTAAESA